MKKLILILGFILSGLLVQGQFSYFDTTGVTAGTTINTLTQAQKVILLDAYASGNTGWGYLKRDLFFTKAEVPAIQEVFALCKKVNNAADTTLAAHPTATNYNQVLDSLEVWFAVEDIPRLWLNEIMVKKVDYCTRAEYLEGLTALQKWNMYLYLLRNQ